MNYVMVLYVGIKRVGCSKMDSFKFTDKFGKEQEAKALPFRIFNLIAISNKTRQAHDVNTTSLQR